MENPEHKTLVSKIIELFQMIFRKLSKLFDKVVFNKKGSLFISLFLAIIISISVNYEDISLSLFHDTTVSVTINDVSVETLADTENYVIEGIPSTVDVTITGSASDVQVYRQQANISAIADVRRYTEGNVVVDIEISQLPSNLEATIQPATAEATISKKVSKQFTVTSELLLGTGQSSSDFESPVLSETTVTIKASQEQIDAIRSVKAIIDATGQTGDFNVEANVMAYDSSGTPLQVDISPATIQASVKRANSDSD